LRRRLSERYVVVALWSARSPSSYIPASAFWKEKVCLGDEPESEIIVPKNEVHRFVKDAFLSIGAPPVNADRMAVSIMEADYRGQFGHGLNRLGLYFNDVKKRILDIAATPVILKESPVTAWVDGKNGPGAVVGIFCMELAIRKAKEFGIGWVVVKMAYQSKSSFLRQPLNGAIGTNPLSFSAPGLHGDGLVVDIATSGVAKGKIEFNMKQGKDIPVGWAINSEGKDLTNAEEAYVKGILMPLGGKELGHKGYGLSLMVEALCGILADASFGPNIRIWQLANEKVANLGQCYACINPEFFAPGFQDRMSNLMDFLRAMEPADANKPVQIPGDWERANVCKHEKLGGIAYKSGLLQWAVKRELWTQAPPKSRNSENAKN
ncbi:hypothetical protein C0J52_20597, partial [Blattella germanica]